MTLSVRGAARSKGGVTDLAMVVWLTIKEVEGISREKLYEKVFLHIPLGHALRSYQKHLDSKHRARNGVGGITKIVSDPPNANSMDDRAKKYYFNKTVSNLLRDNITELDGGLYANTKPKYIGDENKLDPTGLKTEMHFRATEAVRILEPAFHRISIDDPMRRPNLRDSEKKALGELLAAVKYYLKVNE